MKYRAIHLTTHIILLLILEAIRISVTHRIKHKPLNALRRVQTFFQIFALAPTTSLHRPSALDKLAKDIGHHNPPTYLLLSPLSSISLLSKASCFLKSHFATFTSLNPHTFTVSLMQYGQNSQQLHKITISGG